MTRRDAINASLRDMHRRAGVPVPEHLLYLSGERERREAQLPRQDRMDPLGSVTVRQLDIGLVALNPDGKDMKDLFDGPSPVEYVSVEELRRRYP